MILIPLGVLWIGYTLGWYGSMLLRGPGVGIADLVIPSRLSYINEVLGQPPGTIVVKDNQAPNLPAGWTPGVVINPQTGLTQAPPGWHFDPSKNMMVKD